MYTKQITLEHNELPAKISQETGEVTILKQRPNNIPEGKSYLNYNKFGMLNIELSKKLEKYFSNTELSIIFKLINRCEFNTNSLKPFNDETSIRTLAEEFNLSTTTVPKVFNKLFDMGVYLQIKISEDSQVNEYWVLNPYIFWRGKLKDDSLFVRFSNTDISKLLK
jgi:hypothetical protein